MYGSQDDAWNKTVDMVTNEQAFANYGRKQKYVEENKEKLRWVGGSRSHGGCNEVQKLQGLTRLECLQQIIKEVGLTYINTHK